MSTTAALTPGIRVTHRSWGGGTVKPSPTAGGVAALVEFDDGHTIMVRAADLVPTPRETLEDMLREADARGIKPSAVAAEIWAEREPSAPGRRGDTLTATEDAPDPSGFNTLQELLAEARATGRWPSEVLAEAEAEREPWTLQKLERLGVRTEVGEIAEAVEATGGDVVAAFGELYADMRAHPAEWRAAGIRDFPQEYEDEGGEGDA